MKAYEELEKEHEPKSAWKNTQELEKELDFSSYLRSND